MPTPDGDDPAVTAALAEVRRRGGRRLHRRRAGTVLGAVVAAVLAVALPGVVHPPGAHRLRVDVGGAPNGQEDPTVTLPATYPGTGVPLPAALRRPLRLPAVRAGQACPTSPGQPVTTPILAGTALGRGPVRVIVANRGDLTHGDADLGSTATPGWLALKLIWFATPGYDGPFVVRGARVDGPGVMDTGGGQAPQAAPLVVPAGPTDNTAGGYRAVPDGAWVRQPGCYALQVDGLTFTETIVVDMRAGTISGRLEGVGATSEPLAGQVTIAQAGSPAVTVTVGSDGRFSVPVAGGTYTVTGSSPASQAGPLDCRSPDPVSVAAGETADVVIGCGAS